MSSSSPTSCCLILPPLLFNEAYFSSLGDLRANLRPIALLSIVIVGLTTCTVAVVAHALIDGLPWAAVSALGAIVSPTDPLPTDLQSYWLRGHVDGTSQLAEAAAWRRGLPEHEVIMARRGALALDLGRVAVSNANQCGCSPPGLPALSAAVDAVLAAAGLPG